MYIWRILHLIYLTFNRNRKEKLLKKYITAFPAFTNKKVCCHVIFLFIKFQISTNLVLFYNKNLQKNELLDFSVRFSIIIHHIRRLFNYNSYFPIFPHLPFAPFFDRQEYRITKLYIYKSMMDIVQPYIRTHIKKHPFHFLLVQNDKSNNTTICVFFIYYVYKHNIKT